MPHDINGDELHIGDTILIPAKVKSITMDENYCNLTATFTEPMPPYKTLDERVYNTRMVFLANDINLRREK